MKLYFAQRLIDADDAHLPTSPANQDSLDKILTIVFVTIGAIAFFMILVGGVRYIFARSNPEKITQAKNIILYSTIGLILAASAGAIVQVVLDRIRRW